MKAVEFKALLQSVDIWSFPEISSLVLDRVHHHMLCEIWSCAFPAGLPADDAKELATKDIIKLAEIFGYPRLLSEKARQIAKRLRQVDCIPPAVFILAGTPFLDEKIYESIREISPGCQESVSKILGILIAVGYFNLKQDLVNFLDKLEYYSGSNFINGLAEAFSYLYRLEKHHPQNAYFTRGIIPFFLRDWRHSRLSSTLECAKFFGAAIERLSEVKLDTPEYHKAVLNILKGTKLESSRFNDLFKAIEFLQQHRLLADGLIFKALSGEKCFILSLDVAYGLKVITDEFPNVKKFLSEYPDRLQSTCCLIQALKKLYSDTYKTKFKQYALLDDVYGWSSVFTKLAASERIDADSHFVLETLKAVEAHDRLAFLEWVKEEKCDEFTKVQACEVIRRTSGESRCSISDAIKGDYFEEWFKIFLIQAFNAGYQGYFAIGLSDDILLVLKTIQDQAVKDALINGLLQSLRQGSRKTTYVEDIRFRVFFNLLVELIKKQIPLTVELVTSLCEQFQNVASIKKAFHLMSLFSTYAQKRVLTILTHPVWLSLIDELYSFIKLKFYSYPYNLKEGDEGYDPFFSNCEYKDAILSVPLSQLPIVIDAFKQFHASRKAEQWSYGWVMKILMVSPEQCQELFRILDYIEKGRLNIGRDQLKQLFELSARLDELVESINNLLTKQHVVSAREFEELLKSMLKGRPADEMKTFHIATQLPDEHSDPPGFADHLRVFGFLNRGTGSRHLIDEYLGVEVESSVQSVAGRR